MWCTATQATDNGKTLSKQGTNDMLSYRQSDVYKTTTKVDKGKHR